MKKPIRVAITGAAGQIGYSLLFRIASGAVFGPDQPVELNLIEIEPGMKALEGVKMELDDCAFPLLNGIVTTCDLNEGFKGANWALLVGSVPRKKGMERSDLLGINGKIFIGQGQAIEKNAADDIRVLVVGNPCNTNCWIAMTHATNIPANRWFAMTRLDENRGRAQLAQKAGVHVNEVTNMTIWGNHSSTQYPDFYNAKIGGKPATEVISDEAWLKNDFIPIVQKRGAAIIEARGERGECCHRYRPHARDPDAGRPVVQRRRLLRRQLRHSEGNHNLPPRPLRRQELGSRPGARNQRVLARENRRQQQGTPRRTDCRKADIQSLRFGAGA